ncbi:MAG: archaeal proteasome endopeptidase complex subunit alpha [Thermoplasmata archaeon]|nr:MAG: archaeal proteasome endopeptidase complex subunit alpha [Thermoplasmata archaeon]RLF49069.1 MAG: proteasome endopeptidase complex, archaeal, alpha subunit [Thermoplasmata archaeon]RLF63412.1 MAG: proteasome endopeptidase complex, archaeal, alpha subunit [Thermoplasmata archaeon]HDH81569.1 archaeal proteasome endopeptidase complex subunit alpha [Thermoplasmatales archaeon]
MKPQMAYDRAITVFSPDGRLFQVEYAREAVKRGTTTVGLKFDEGVVLIVDRRITSRLVEPSSIEKIFMIDEHIGCATSGLVADARVLVDRARMEAQINRITYDEKIQVKTLVKKICDFKQTYTQYGGVRPFGTAFLIGGVDDEGPRLFATDPSGAMMEYKATAEGNGRDAALEYLEKNYKMTNKDEVIEIGLKALYEATDKNLDKGAIEMGIVTKKENFRILSEKECEKYFSKAVGK